MTEREYIATHIMAGLVAFPAEENCGSFHSNGGLKTAAKYAVTAADELLAALMVKPMTNPDNTVCVERALLERAILYVQTAEGIGNVTFPEAAIVARKLQAVLDAEPTEGAE